jgi:hypothetical protein
MNSAGVLPALFFAAIFRAELLIPDNQESRSQTPMHCSVNANKCLAFGKIRKELGPSATDNPPDEK